MKADIEWVDRLENGLKRKVRVTFTGRDKIKWSVKLSDDPRWDYDTPPSAEDWATLEEKMASLYNRRRTSFKKLELVRALKKAATPKRL